VHKLFHLTPVAGFVIYRCDSIVFEKYCKLRPGTKPAAGRDELRFNLKFDVCLNKAINFVSGADFPAQYWSKQVSTKQRLSVKFRNFLSDKIL
jgi:hypothetical protein